MDNIDSDIEEDPFYGSSDDDEDYVPNESDEFEYTSEEEEDDGSLVATQEEREQAIVQPASWLLSKDQTIQYSQDECPVNPRSNATQNIHKGICSVLVFFIYI